MCSETHLHLISVCPGRVIMARSTLDDFVLKEKVGSGSYGAVFRAQRKVDRQTYALKEVDLQGMKRKEQEECIKETQILSSLNCDNIIKYYDSFLENGKLYICMEYAAAGNLHDFIKRQTSKLPEQLIWKFFIQMLLGLHHMHEHKVLHRDMKTLNTFLDQNLNVKLGDLGVAKVLSSHSNFAETIIGTPYYLSPEMCEDKPYNQKSDCWALGVCLYECCTQKHPFDADNQGALMLKILQGKYPAVQGYSKELTSVVKACLTLDHHKRPDTNSLLSFKAVRDAAAEQGIELPPAPTVAKQAGTTHTGAAGALAGGKKPTASCADSAAKPGPKPSRSVKERAKTPDSNSSTGAADMRISPRGAAGIPAATSSSSSRPVSATAAGKAADKQAGGVTRATGANAAPSLQLQGLSIGLESPGQGSAGRQASGGPTTPIIDSAAGSGFDEASVQQSGSSWNGGADGTTPPSSDRSHHIRDALPNLRNSIIDLVGPGPFKALHMLVNMTADADLHNASAAGSDALVRGVERIITDKTKAATVLPLLFKLMYLEAQLAR